METKEKKQTAKSRLLKWLGHTPKQWVAKGTIEKVVMNSDANYTADYIGRLLRSMHMEGKLKVKYVKNHAWYSIDGEVELDDAKAIEIFDKM